MEFIKKKIIWSWSYLAVDNINTTFSSIVKAKDGGSMEDLTSNGSNVERQTKIKSRLRKFFHRRPTIESLVKKGIWKGIC